MNATDIIRSALTTSFEWLLQLAEDLADSPFTLPTTAGGNHPLWVMGHVTYSTNSLLAMISGRANPLEQWEDLFAGGTLPRQDSAIYPSYAEVMKSYRQAHESALLLLDEIGESGLDAKPTHVRDNLRELPDFQSNGRVLLFIAMHEMAHFGQLADARRSLGRQPFA